MVLAGRPPGRRRRGGLQLLHPAENNAAAVMSVQQQSSRLTRPVEQPLPNTRDLARVNLARAVYDSRQLSAQSVARSSEVPLLVFRASEVPSEVP